MQGQCRYSQSGSAGGYGESIYAEKTAKKGKGGGKKGAAATDAGAAKGGKKGGGKDDRKKRKEGRKAAMPAPADDLDDAMSQPVRRADSCTHGTSKFLAFHRSHKFAFIILVSSVFQIASKKTKARRKLLPTLRRCGKLTAQLHGRRSLMAFQSKCACCGARAIGVD